MHSRSGGRLIRSKHPHARCGRWGFSRSMARMFLPDYWRNLRVQNDVEWAQSQKTQRKTEKELGLIRSLADADEERIRTRRRRAWSAGDWSRRTLSDPSLHVTGKDFLAKSRSHLLPGLRADRWGQSPSPGRMGGNGLARRQHAPPRIRKGARWRVVSL